MLFTLALFSLIFFNLDRGFNFNDESMHLYSISHPDWPLSLWSDFGAMLHPIFDALGQDVYNFRVWTFITLLSFSALLIISFFLLIKRHVKLSPWTWCALFFALWGSTLGYYTYWLPTASYNTLALFGVLGVLSALNFYSLLLRPQAFGKLFANRKVHAFLKYLVLLLLAISGVLAFCGKTTTGAGIGILACIYMYFVNNAKRERIYDIFKAGVFALIILLSYLFFVSNGLETIAKIINATKLIDSTYGFGATLAYYAHYFVPISYVLVLFTWPLWIGVLFAICKEKYPLALGLVSFTLLLILLAAYIWIVNFIAALSLWPLAALVFVGSCMWKVSWQHVRFGLRMALLFFISGIIYHAGTNTPLEYKLSESLILPCLSVISLCLGMQNAKRVIILPSLAVILSFVTLASLFYSIFEPTRHNGYALWELSEPVELKANTKPIYVHKERKIFMEWIRKTAFDNGWEVGNPVINTSFYSSGSLFLLDGFKVEGAWQIQERYTPKENYAVIMSLASEDLLRKAWIIKPVNDGPRHMPSSVLKENGLPFPEGYELLSTSPAESVEGVWPAEQYEIWKPKSN